MFELHSHTSDINMYYQTKRHTDKRLLAADNFIHACLSSQYTMHYSLQPVKVILRQEKETLTLLGKEFKKYVAFHPS